MIDRYCLRAVNASLAMLTGRIVERETLCDEAKDKDTHGVDKCSKLLCTSKQEKEGLLPLGAVEKLVGGLISLT